MAAVTVRSAEQLAGSWRRVAVAMFAVGWGANQFSPLLIEYRHDLSLSAGTLAGIFGIYAAALIPGLLIGGPVSDRIGRRPVVLPFVVLSPLATLMLMLGPRSLPVIAAGRALAGLCSGVVFGSATAWVQELSDDPAASARRSAVALSAGFACGPAIAAVLAQWARAGGRGAGGGAGRRAALAAAGGAERPVLAGGRARRALGVRGGLAGLRGPAPGGDQRGQRVGGLRGTDHHHHRGQRDRGPATGPAARGPAPAGRGDRRAGLRRGRRRGGHRGDRRPQSGGRGRGGGGVGPGLRTVPGVGAARVRAPGRPRPARRGGGLLLRPHLPGLRRPLPGRRAERSARPDRHLRRPGRRRRGQRRLDRSLHGPAGLPGPGPGGQYPFQPLRAGGYEAQVPVFP